MVDQQSYCITSLITAILTNQWCYFTMYQVLQYMTLGWHSKYINNMHNQSFKNEKNKTTLDIAKVGCFTGQMTFNAYISMLTISEHKLQWETFVWMMYSTAPIIGCRGMSASTSYSCQPDKDMFLITVSKQMLLIYIIIISICFFKLNDKQ